MYKCENCNKPPYKTKKRYLNHIKICGEKTQSIKRLREQSSTQSRNKSQKSLRQRTASIESLESIGSEGSIEYTDSKLSRTRSIKSVSKYSESEYKDLIRKLSKENKKYAKKLKDLLKKEDELNHYYHEKIAVLEEKNVILDRELKYSKKNRQNDSKEVHALQDTIDQLEKQLDINSQQAMQMSNEHNQLQKHLSEEIKRYESQIMVINQQLTRERLLNKQLKDKVEYEIEEYKKSINEQKYSELNALNTEKNEMQKRWENKRKEIINGIQEMEEKQKNEIRQLTSEYEARISAQKEEESKLRISYKETLNREKQMAVNRMDKYREEKKQEIIEIEERHKKEIQKMNALYEKKIGEKIIAVQLKSSDISKECEALKQQIEDNKKVAEEEREKKVNELKAEFKLQYRDFQLRIEEDKKKIKEEFNTELENKEKEIKKITKLYEKVKYEYEYYKNLATRLTKTNEQFNDQYLNNFNNQSESHKLVLQEKDKRIIELEKDLNSTRNNYQSRIEVIGKELKEKYEQVKNLEDGVSELRALNEKYKREKSNIANRFRQQLEILQGENKELQEEKETKRKCIYEQEQTLKELSKKEEEYKKRILELESKISRYTSQIKGLQEGLTANIESKKYIEIQYEIVKEELEKVKKERDANYYNLTQIQIEYKNSQREFNQVASKYEEMINDLEAKLNLKSRDYETLQSRLKNLIKISTEEREKMKKNYLDTLNEHTKNLENSIKIKEIEVINANKYAKKASDQVELYKYKIEEKEKQLQEALSKAKETPMLSMRATKIDDAMKRGRDEALRKIRIQKEALTKLEVTNNKLKIELRKYQEQLKTKEGELDRMLETQNGLKEQYVTILNEREQKHKVDLSEKDKRINELETIMMSKLKLAEASK